LEEHRLDTKRFLAVQALDNSKELAGKATMRPIRMIKQDAINVAFGGATYDEDIPITPPLSPTPFDEDVAAKKSNEIRIGPITRARVKLLEQ
jgi:hypothetical protein